MPRRASDQRAALEAWLEGVLGAPLVYPFETVAHLWAGYGRILRVRTRQDAPRSFVLKQIRFPAGKDSDLSHTRKVRSYEVERTFYERFAQHSRPRARTPQLLGARRVGDELWLLLEDLDAAGFSARPRSGSPQVVQSGVEWLAAFHAAHLGRAPDGLWREGSYWHLATRPDELRAIKGHPLHAQAPLLDAALRRARYRTLIHGDPKLENFCATPGPQPMLAAVDFQYIGGGVGIRDLVYFIGSAVAPGHVERELPALVDAYFARLRHELELVPGPTDVSFAELETEWRALVPLAWLDFYRFTLGWSPTWAKSDIYAQRLLPSFAG